MNAIRTLKVHQFTRFTSLLALTLGLLGVVRSSSPQILDTNFTPDANLGPVAIAIQPDGRVLAGESFSFYRLHRDGFHESYASGLYSFTTALLVQADGRIFVGADYNSDGPGSAKAARVNPGQSATPINAGLNNAVYAAALQADEKVLAAGLNGVSLTNRIARINPDDTDDTHFRAFASFSVYNLTVQPDGKILVGGFFGLLNGQRQQIIGRLNNDGSLDTSFTPSPIGHIDGAVQTMLLQPDGKILIGGAFTVIGGHDRKRIARLHPDGAVDTTFDAGNVGGKGNHVNSLALQANGKILVSGDFTTLAGHACTNVGRLNPDGSFDAALAGSDGGYWADGLALHPDGSIFATAFILAPNDQFIPFARFFNTDPATNLLTRAGSTLTWSRGGAVPEVWRTTFEASTNNGASWLFLGAGTHGGGGWQLTNVSLPANATVRARGYYTTGRFNASSSIDEKIIGPPVIVSHPTSQSGYAGDSVRFFGAAGGAEPLSYQWRRHGTNLVETADLIGAETPSLTLRNIFLGRDQADYSFVASNSFGSVTSQVATLTIYEPVIVTQPLASQRMSPGHTATISVMAAGTPPLSYQWFKDGTKIAGATQSSLVLSNVQFSDTGIYDVTVSNSFGFAGSSFSSLVVSFVEPDSLATISNQYSYLGLAGSIQCVLPLPDGKLLVGGQFESLGEYECTNLARINLDGSVDGTFTPAPTRSDWPPASVQSLAVQADGRILVKGDFDTIARVARTNFARLHADGTFDSSFSPADIGPDGPLAVQANGKILTTDYKNNANRLVRLNPDGTPDASWPALVVQETWAGSITTFALAEDGKILVGGTFDQIAGQPRTNLARLNVDGTLDSGFVAHNVRSPFAIQRDGNVLVGGWFDSTNGWPFGLLRLNSNGTVDSSFSPIEIRSQNYVVAVQSDGKILMGRGSNSLKRFNTDGSEDFSFNMDLDGQVERILLAADGKVLIQGAFTTVNGAPRWGFCRLLNDPAQRTLHPGASTVTWSRGGSSPEVWRTTFEYSTDGTAWINLGDGTRMAGGWQASSVSLPANSTLRARGFVNGGTSQWFVEETAPVGIELFPGRTANQFMFQARVVPGRPVVIESSTNLANWTAVHTNPPAATNLIYHLDPESSQLPHRFYRVRSP